jgi:hypothetical protein
LPSERLADYNRVGLYMFLSDITILVIFGHAAVRTAAPPLLAMTGVTAFWIYRDHRKVDTAEPGPTLALTSPISLVKILRLPFLFLTVQAFATLGQRRLV